MTGGAGFVGSHLVDRLMAEGAHVRVVDDFSSGTRSNVQNWQTSERFELIEGDIRDLATMERAVAGVNLVFHQAAIVSVPISTERPRLVTDVNVIGTATILDACRKSDVQHIVVTSSAAVYGNQEHIPIPETAEKKPLSPYGASKLAAEEVSLSFGRTYGLPITVLRPFNIYGPRQRGTGYAGVITIFLKSAIANKPLVIEGDGMQTRDFVYVGDITEANLLAAQKNQTAGEIYNIGSGNRITIQQLAELIIDITESQSHIEFGKPRKGDIRDSQASIQKAQKELGYRPKVTIRDGLTRTANWFADMSGTIESGH